MGARGRPKRRIYFERFVSALNDIARCGGLPLPEEARDVWKGLWHREVHHSTAIEGNTLVLKEVAALLDTGRTVGAKQHKEYLEVLGYSKAAAWVYENARTRRDPQEHELLTITEVRETHGRAMADVWAIYPHEDALPGEGPGSFRLHDIHAFGGGMVPPSFPLVPSEVDLWVKEVGSFGERILERMVASADIPLELARIHRRFEFIHPFLDGNGRTGRLLLNLILVRLGWPPAIIFKSERERYLAALDRSDKGDDGRLAELIARAVIRSTHQLLPDIAGPIKLLPLSTLASSELSLAALKQAAARGRLESYIDSDGILRSSKKAVDAYKAERYKRDYPNPKNRSK
ncbi:MAG: Fic family protein [Demequinaceae bacterium]|nr:Fic family protein [Demequinaceae bacterium]